MKCIPQAAGGFSGMCFTKNVFSSITQIFSFSFTLCQTVEDIRQLEHHVLYYADPVDTHT